MGVLNVSVIIYLYLSIYLYIYIYIGLIGRVGGVRFEVSMS